MHAQPVYIIHSSVKLFCIYNVYFDLQESLQKVHLRTVLYTIY